MNIFDLIYGFTFIPTAESEERKGILVICASLIAGMVGILVALEILQVYTLGLTYLHDWTNYLEVILYITSILFISSAVHRCICAAYWQWQVGVVAVFLAWIDFLIFIRILPGGALIYSKNFSLVYSILTYQITDLG